jgi:general secretion pathway protein J
MTPTVPRNGFTLIEMLVALSLFAILSAAGVMLLRGSVDTQDAVKGRLSESAGVNRLNALLTQDAAQALPRTTRDAAGRPRAAFVGDGQGFALVRGGAGVADERPGVARIFYRVAGGELRRGVQPAPDGVDPAAGDTMLRAVERASFRYRRADGSWVERWTADDPAALPRAIEMTFAPRGRDAITMVAAMPPAPAPEAPEPQP